MATALITGISGQDGSYLAELLISKGYNIIGTVRNVEAAKSKLANNYLSHIVLFEWDLQDQHLLVKILEDYQPTEVYNCAAFASGSGMFDDPLSLSQINGIAVTRILEAIRLVNPNIRFCQTSSREIFGATNESPQTEATRINPRSPYGASKAYADMMVNIYRQHYNIFACSAILYNHESPRRGLSFVTRKITHTAAKIKLGLANELVLGNLETRRDWGFAGDFVRAMWLMLQHNQADDYIVATGEAHSVRSFCEIAFNRLKLNYRDYVREDRIDYRPSEPALLIGNFDKARIRLGWEPETSFVALVQMMVDADINTLVEINERN